MAILAEVRTQIDKIDLQIVKLLSKRYKYTEIVGQYKAANNLSPVDLSREKAQSEKFAKLSRELGLDEQVVWKIFKTIIDDVVKNHIKLQKK